jgi:hypothetical protein
LPTPARLTPGGIIKSWERRRLPYNLFVGSASALTLARSHVLIALPPGGEAMPLFWPPIVFFGVLANVCYLFGPITEILITKIWGDQLLPTGPVLYRIVLTCSVGLALLPTLIMSVG